MLLPQVRTAGIIEQEISRELLVYDLQINKAYNLNETLRTVYRACGKLTFDEFKRQSKFSDDLIYLALDELKANNLLEGDVKNHFGGLPRREVIKKVGLASMVALPVISSLVAPIAAQAQSALRCVSNSDCPPSNISCQDNLCAGGTCQLVPAPAGSPAGNGQICDGGGNAVQCITSFDCPGQDNVCQTRICNSGVCGFSFAPDGTFVGNGLVCDGGGGIRPAPPV